MSTEFLFFCTVTVDISSKTAYPGNNVRFEMTRQSTQNLLGFKLVFFLGLGGVSFLRVWHHRLSFTISFVGHSYPFAKTSRVSCFGNSISLFHFNDPLGNLQGNVTALSGTDDVRMAVTSDSGPRIVGIKLSRRSARSTTWHSIST